VTVFITDYELENDFDASTNNHAELEHNTSANRTAGYDSTMNTSSHLNGVNGNMTSPSDAGAGSVKNDHLSASIRVNRIESSEYGEGSQHSSEDQVKTKTKSNAKLKIKFNLGKKKKNMIEDSESEEECEAESAEASKNEPITEHEKTDISMLKEPESVDGKKASSKLEPNDEHGAREEKDETPQVNERRLRNSAVKSKPNTESSPTQGVATKRSSSAANRSKQEVKDEPGSSAASSVTSPSISDTSRSSRNRSATKSKNNNQLNASASKDTTPTKSTVENKNTRRSSSNKANVSLTNGKTNGSSANKKKTPPVNNTSLNGSKKKQSASKTSTNKRTRNTSQVSAGSTEDSLDSDEEASDSEVDLTPPAPVAKKVVSKKSLKH
jgi:hypothetical protein